MCCCFPCPVRLEKRVLEAKLQKAIEAHDYNVQKLQSNAVAKIQEIMAFLDLERQEKELLQAKLSDANETVHQLTHHLKVLQAQIQAQQSRDPEYTVSGKTGTSLLHGKAGNGTLQSLWGAGLHVQDLLPGASAPWEPGSLPRSTSKDVRSTHHHTSPHRLRPSATDGILNSSKASATTNPRAIRPTRSTSPAGTSASSRHRGRSPSRSHLSTPSGSAAGGH